MEEYIVAALIEIEERTNRERTRLKSLRDASNPFELDSAKFKKIFHFPKASALYLCEKLSSYPELSEIGSIPKHLLILAALHFYADGSYQAPIGEDSLISISQPTMSRALEATTNAIVQLLSAIYIKFPTTSTEKSNTMREFQEKYNMPNVVGAVDGSHIPIFKPPNTDPYAPGIIFYNRKGFYSINCQVVCNAKGRITSVNPNFPGSTHDSAVWRSSALARHLEREFVQGAENQWLLGDEGYPLLPWLMTPVLAPESEAEQNYNICHARARNVVEMTFGRLKNKLRCLHKHRTLHYEPTKAANITIACITLYNMFCDVLSDDEDDHDDDDGDDVDNDVDSELNEDADSDYLAMARAKRHSLVQHFA